MHSAYLSGCPTKEKQQCARTNASPSFFSEKEGLVVTRVKAESCDCKPSLSKTGKVGRKRQKKKLLHNLGIASVSALTLGETESVLHACIRLLCRRTREYKKWTARGSLEDHHREGCRFLTDEKIFLTMQIEKCRLMATSCRLFSVVFAGFSVLIMQGR